MGRPTTLCVIDRVNQSGSGTYRRATRAKSSRPHPTPVAVVSAAVATLLPFRGKGLLGLFPLACITVGCFGGFMWYSQRKAQAERPPAAL
jgi:hypothetical protein